MNSRNRKILLAAGIFTLAIGCRAVVEERIETISRSWPADSVRRIDLNEIDGSVNVVAKQISEVRLVAEVRSRGVEAKPNQENKGFFETTLDSGTLNIGRRKHVRVRLPFIYSNDVSVDYTIEVPPTVALELKTVNGRISTRGVNAELAAVTVNGTLDLEADGSSEVTAKTVNGRLRARFTHDFKGANLKAVNGSVTAVLPRNSSFACDLSQVNGDFEATFPLSIHSHPGRRRVSGEVNGGRYDLHITTVNGDIQLEHGNGAQILTPPAPPAAPTAVPGVPVAPATPPAPPATTGHSSTL